MNRLLLSAIILGSLASSFCSAQSWVAVQNVPSIGAYNPTLLTDGRILIQDAANSDWWTLTPDSFGNYVDGTWTQVGSTNGWGPLYYASDVMPDGRVFALGGEYDFSGPAVWDNQGAIFNPATNTWTTISPPNGWSSIGDMASEVLPNGEVFLADPFTNQDALFNPATNSYTSPYGSGKGDGNDEEGLTLLPNGNLYTVDVLTAQGAEAFNTSTATWAPIAKTPVNLVLTADEEIGPGVLMYNGQVFQFGGNGANAIYNPTTNTWATAPSFPNISAGQIECADAPACLLPNGNILVEASPGYGNLGCYFYIWNGTSLTQITGTPDAAETPGFAGNFLTLPNGQIMYTDQSPNVMLYNPGGTAVAAAAPTITNAPTTLKAGSSYIVYGQQFNGLSQGSYYGDDEQNYTNYPIIKLTMTNGAVYYCKEYSPSTMAICTGTATVSTHFTVPGNVPLGSAKLQVVTNGIASTAVPVTIAPPVGASSVSVFQGTNGHGTVQSITAVDGNFYSAESVNSSSGQIVAVKATFNLPQSSLQSVGLRVSAGARSGATEQVYAYNFKTATWVLLGAGQFNGSVQTLLTETTGTNASQYISPANNNEVELIVRAVLPTHVSTAPFTMLVDMMQIQYS